ncbi:metal ABC transporter permease [Paracoccus sp. DMF-8]|nr:metal ABC transporter permease [Paracoccus sp. DMF-8]MDF3607618.1 metal ABC transporter permease [Paracoccus sp. DMF-8]
MSWDAFRQLVQSWAEAGWLPASLAWGFAVNALVAGLIIGPVLGALGTLVVIKRHAFFSEAVGHAALTGVAIGILLGEPYTGPYGSLFGYCLIFGIALNYLRNRNRPVGGYADRGVSVDVAGHGRQHPADPGGQGECPHP